MIVLVIGVVTGLNVPIVPCKNRVYNLTKPPEQTSQQKIDFLFSPLGRLGNQFQVYGKTHGIRIEDRATTPPPPDYKPITP